MLAGLAKLQPDPEAMEWERTNLTYYVSEIPPRMPREGGLLADVGMWEGGGDGDGGGGGGGSC